MTLPTVGPLIWQSSSSTGTGNFTLSSLNGFRDFSEQFTAGATPDTLEYLIRRTNDVASLEWERGTGHLSVANTLVRDTVIEGSNGTGKVDFSAGTKDITCFYAPEHFAVIQMQTGKYSTRLSSTATLSLDDTVWQSSEGVEVTTWTFTPKRADSTLQIEWLSFMASNPFTHFGCALFKDSDSGALATAFEVPQQATEPAHIRLAHKMDSPGNGQITFKIRAGQNGSATFYVNYSGINYFGAGQIRSTWRVWEFYE